MEKRSHRRIRDLDVLTAFQGLVANEIGCARISMMASEQETLPQWAEYRCARPIISRSSHPACTARPVHTEWDGPAVLPPPTTRRVGWGLEEHEEDTPCPAKQTLQSHAPLVSIPVRTRCI